MALAKLIPSLIAAVGSHRQPENDRLNEIRQLDAEIAAECWKRNLTIPKIDSGRNLRPFGQTQIPHVCGLRAEPGMAERLLHYHFFASDNWLQAMRALALMDDVENSDSKRGSRSKKNHGKAKKNTPDRSALKPKQLAALEIIEQEGPILGKVIAIRLKLKVSTLSTHYIPKIRPFGVTRGSDGYYIART